MGVVVMIAVVVVIVVMIAVVVLVVARAAAARLSASDQVQLHPGAAHNHRPLVTHHQPCRRDRLLLPGLTELASSACGGRPSAGGGVGGGAGRSR